MELLNDQWKVVEMKVKRIVLAAIYKFISRKSTSPFKKTLNQYVYDTEVS